MHDNLSKLPLAIAEDIKLLPFMNTMKCLGGMLISKIDNTSQLFRDILINCDRAFSDLDEEEKESFNEECYIIFQHTITGKAKHNIELLIKYLKGQIEQKELYIDNFYKHMDVISNLTLDEIKFMSVIKDKVSHGVFNGNQTNDTIRDNNEIAIAHSLQGKGLVIIKSIQAPCTDYQENLNYNLTCRKTKILEEIFKYVEIEINDDE